jgi:hypothetical protein
MAVAIFVKLAGYNLSFPFLLYKIAPVSESTSTAASLLISRVGFFAAYTLTWFDKMSIKIIKNETNLDNFQHPYFLFII